MYIQQSWTNHLWKGAMCYLRFNGGELLVQIGLVPLSVKMDMPWVLAEKIRDRDSKCSICRQILDKLSLPHNYKFCFICHKKRLAAARKLVF